jgi:hypothetical protein
MLIFNAPQSTIEFLLLIARVLIDVSEQYRHEKLPGLIVPLAVQLGTLNLIAPNTNNIWCSRANLDSAIWVVTCAGFSCHIIAAYSEQVREVRKKLVDEDNIVWLPRDEIRWLAYVPCACSLVSKLILGWLLIELIETTC